MPSLFEIRRNSLSTRHFQVLSNKGRRAVNYGLETICYITPFLLANLPPEYKFANYLNIFNRKIRNWKGENYLCWLCKTYVRELGYIQFARSLIISITFFFLVITCQIQLKNLKKPFHGSTVHKKPFVSIAKVIEVMQIKL